VKSITGNSRFIYEKRSIEEFDFVQSLKKVDSFIEKSHKLSRSNPDNYIYFFTSSCDAELFRKTPCWVGREVIGFSASDVIEDEGLGSKDLDGGAIHSFSGPDTLDLNELFKLEQEIRKDHEFVSTWRVKINTKNSPIFTIQFWE